ncbi:UvrD-helicase domain-containing protein [Marinilabiliaceae bacterium ANBcel2]|nr:UvrD-helicase domain-containing protein [Marinilabiliaceae bacterium ANBcel2]
MSKLKIYKASAGSGKTFTLTQEYIELLFYNHSSFRNTLAVTFTNKATAEMRARILTKLHNLSNPEIKNPDYLNNLKVRYKLSEENVRKKAKEILTLLLHDFSRFSISTIDSFFQRITRSFAREMGLPIGFRLEVETDQIMTEAIDRLILEMDSPQYSEVKKWLIQYAKEQMENEKSWNISAELNKAGQEIFKENYQENASLLSAKVNDRYFLTTYKKALEEIVNNIDISVKEIGEKVIKEIEKHGFNISSDFKGKSRSAVKVFKNMAERDDFMQPQKTAKLLQGIDEWIPKTAPAKIKNIVENLYNSSLKELTTKAHELITNNIFDYNTAKAILKNLNGLGLLNDINNKMYSLCHDQNLFLISGTNHLLKKIIDNNESPFIYEKTGTRFENYMIDEFQDTSSLQYKNFLPLIKDSLAANNLSLIVGDVKQAVYRWRNSDWNLLASEIEKDFDEKITGIDHKTLDTNWRSKEEIVKFNNSFFSSASKALQKQFNLLLPEKLIEDNTTDLSNKISNAYSDIVQNVAGHLKNSGGNISIEFIGDTSNSEQFQNEAVTICINKIEDFINKGNSLSDICILVRTNKEAVTITNALLSGEFHPENKIYPVISNESLIIGNSEAVKLIVAQLNYIKDSSNKVIESFIKQTVIKQTKPFDYNSTNNPNYNLSNTYHNNSVEKEWEEYRDNILELKEKPLYTLAESLISMLPKTLLKKYPAYLQEFLSIVLNFINKESADLNKFTEYWNKSGYKASLNIPDNQNAIRVMTIHKSKGLEFKSVIIPFANWTFKNSSGFNSDKLWLKPQTEPFNAMPVVPVDANNKLTQTHFAHEYLEEILYQYVDNLNITYVAFTRAEENLAVISKAPSKKKSSDIEEIKKVSDLLYFFASNSNTTYPDAWNSSENSFIINKKDHTANNKKEKEEYQFRPSQNSKYPITFTSSSKRVAMNNHLESDNYFSNDTKSADYGKLMHKLFEKVITIEDLDYALTEMKFSGMINGLEENELRDKIILWINNPKVKPWFDGTFKIKTEAQILDDKIKRPDRVMIKDDLVQVVDYKFSEAISPSHYQQIKEYILLLTKMGYKKVEGFLWYPFKNKIIKVDNQMQLF